MIVCAVPHVDGRPLPPARMTSPQSVSVRLSSPAALGPYLAGTLLPGAVPDFADAGDESLELTALGHGVARGAGHATGCSGSSIGRPERSITVGNSSGVTSFHPGEDSVRGCQGSGWCTERECQPSDRMPANTSPQQIPPPRSVLSLADQKIGK